MNVLFVMSDMLRTTFLGGYGNRTIHTPNIDRLCRSGTPFTRDYPESLPKGSARHAIHAGNHNTNLADNPWQITGIPHHPMWP